MSADVNDWKELYSKDPETEEEFVIPEGPLLFYNELVIDHFTNPGTSERSMTRTGMHLLVTRRAATR